MMTSPSGINPRRVSQDRARRRDGADDDASLSSSVVSTPSRQPKKSQKTLSIAELEAKNAELMENYEYLELQYEDLSAKCDGLEEEIAALDVGDHAAAIKCLKGQLTSKADLEKSYKQSIRDKDKLLLEKLASFSRSTFGWRQGLGVFNVGSV